MNFCLVLSFLSFLTLLLIETRLSLATNENQLVIEKRFNQINKGNIKNQINNEGPSRNGGLGDDDDDDDDDNKQKRENDDSKRTARFNQINKGNIQNQVNNESKFKSRVKNQEDEEEKRRSVRFNQINKGDIKNQVNNEAKSKSRVNNENEEDKKRRFVRFNQINKGNIKNQINNESKSKSRFKNQDDSEKRKRSDADLHILKKRSMTKIARFNQINKGSIQNQVNNESSKHHLIKREVEENRINKIGHQNKRLARFNQINKGSIKNQINNEGGDSSMGVKSKNTFVKAKQPPLKGKKPKE